MSESKSESETKAESEAGTEAGSEGCIRVAAGARATEAALLGEIQALSEAARRDSARLERPVWVVVPSGSLREHLSARIVAHAGCAVAGLAVVTLHTLAAEILRRAGRPTPASESFFPIVVRQQARREASLRLALEELSDGYGVVSATVADLLDAGLEPAIVDGLDECLAAAGEGGGVTRARAVVRVAAATGVALEGLEIGHASQLFRGAREALLNDADVLPARAVLVHGFADVTGVQLELLEAMVTRSRATVFVDLPPQCGPDPGHAFTDRLLERLAGIAPRIDAPASSHSVVPPRLFRAPGAHAEARAVAARIATLLVDGALPESIGVVARELGPYRVAIRTQFRRLGVPFSGAPGSVGAIGPIGRRLRALLDLLQGPGQSSVDGWIEALGRMETVGQGAQRRAQLADLRVGLHALGAGRLRDLMGLVADDYLDARDGLPLPVRRGLVDAEDEAGDPLPSRARRRRLAGDVLREALMRGQGLLRRCEAWASADRLGAHWDHLEALVREDLGWEPDDPWRRKLSERIATLRAELDAALRLDRVEFALLLDRALTEVGALPLGGQGGGVQVLGLLEARARTFEHLFVVGLSRDLFPRPVSDDPLLPDWLRAPLRAVLPDVPIKQRSAEEERYLFSQLVSASPDVTLSWQTVSDDGKSKTPSPLIEQIRSTLGESIPLAPSLLADPACSAELSDPACFAELSDPVDFAELSDPVDFAEPSDPAVPAGRGEHPGMRTALEHASRAGIRRDVPGFRRALGVALREGRAQLQLPSADADCAQLAQARCAIVQEMDPGHARARSLGPYFGFVGRAGEGDPRQQALYVTTLESVARCPWQAFLEKVLRLEPLPDALDALPDIDSLLLGNVVHRTLERFVVASRGEAPVGLADLVGRVPVDVAWPAPAELEALMLAAARDELRGEGIGLPGFAALVGVRARPILDRIRESEAPEGKLHGVLAAEVQGEVRLGDALPAARVLYFRADRVDGGPDGLRLTDYKTGKPRAAAARTERRREKLLAEISAGGLLQASAYALASTPGVVSGRYVFAGTEREAAVSHEVARDDAEARASFVASVTSILRAWQVGSFVPRLADTAGREPPACEHCRVAEACLRGDSGARHRLVGWTGDSHEELREAEAALMAVWNLPSRPS